jgi:arylsulfatase A-like enzyme
MLVFIVWVSGTIPGVSQPVDSKPNIILFLVDDMGWMDCGAYGSQYYETPHMDALADRGMLFTDAYAANPCCSPTRASILTGQYPARHGIIGAHAHLPPHPPGHNYRPDRAPAHQKYIFPGPIRFLDTSYYTIAEALKDAGYRTAHLGKWHLGVLREHWPDKHGFDVVFHCSPDPGPQTYFSPYGIHTDGEPNMGHRVGNIPDGPDGEYLMDRLAAEAEKFIEESREIPFLLHLWSYGVHSPWQAKEEYTKEYFKKKDPRGKQRNPIMASMLQSVDECLGRIVAKLEEEGLSGNTLIIFTSDNGGTLLGYSPDHPHTKRLMEKGDPTLLNYRKWAGMEPPTNNYPLNKGKLSIFEGGVRVPFLVVWPGVIEPGSRSSEMVNSIDLYPTIAEVAGAVTMPGQVIDGISLLPVLTGSGSLGRNIMFNYKPESHARWQYPSAASVREGDWKLIRRFETAEAYPEEYVLFNLREDIGESHDLALENPRKVKELKKMLDRHFREMETLLPIQNPDYDPDIKQ